jgi:transposase
VLLSNRLDRTAEQVVNGYAGQQQLERVFRGLKDGDWLGCGPMHHWTDRKIRSHAFYCMLGISLLQYVHRQAKEPLGAIFPWNNSSKSYDRFSSSSSSIPDKARKALFARPMCCRSKLWRSRLWPRH